MAYRIVKDAGGVGRIQLVPGRCKFVVKAGELCLEPVRLAPGAIFCHMHRDQENAGCAEHDRLGCKQCK